MIMFGNNSQINFVVIEFGEFDEIIRSFETSFISIAIFFIISSISRTPYFSINFFIFLKTNFVQYEITELLIRSRSINITITEINLDKRSALNKRAYV